MMRSTETILGFALRCGLAAALIPCGLGTAAANVPVPTEVCDGVDNDGNGQIDEGFDLDGDGVARCCGRDPFFVTTSLPPTQLTAHERSCTAAGFTTQPAPLAEVPPGSALRVNAVDDLTGDGLLDVVWTEVATGTRNLTQCEHGIEWTTRPVGSWRYNYFGGADLDLDSDVDLVAWDLACCFNSGPILGPGPLLGVTAIGTGGGGFNELYGTYDPSPVLGDWQAARVYNLQDVDSDGLADLLFHSYASGGASPTDIYLAQGAGGTFWPPIPAGTVAPPPPFPFPGQPQNWGDLGDIDNDGCADWMGGPDDDGDRGSVFAFYGDCTGSFAGPVEVADACNGCPGSGTGHGSGMSQLYDWDCDDRLELLTSHVAITGSTAWISYYDNVGGSFTGPTVVLTGALLTRIASPLRN